MKTAKLMHTSCIYLERLSFYLYIQHKIISKCITLMTTKRQRHTYISKTGNVVYRRMAENGFAPPLGNFADISYLIEN